MTCCPHASPSRCPMARARLSLTPPGATGTRMVIGLVGYVWADAAPGARHASASRTANDFGMAILLVDRQLLLVDHLGPFLRLSLDVVGELLRRVRHRLEHLRRQEFFAETGVGQNLRDLGVELHHD